MHRASKPEDFGEWEYPLRISQTDLFPTPRDQMLALIGVSIDEVERWRSFGWISFDVRDVPNLDGGRTAEICFIRNLARSGLGDLQINRLLAELEPPYTYSPLETAYSFAYGWVRLPPPLTELERDEDVEHHLDAWLQRKVLYREHQILRDVAHKILATLAIISTNESQDTEADES